ncbi:MAG TPA: ThiF family adenylyltransferase [Steroidobacteraceae bacterium]|nr:ThiF family adenylyltransferase [Steroidobacteraceae bacterium]
MRAFSFTRDPIDTARERAALADRACGGYASFEGWVRDHNEGRRVTHLEYEAFEPLALKEAERILAEAAERFGVERAACVHRVGDLAIGAMAVWVGVSARHRDEAFRACRYIIDEVKHRLPIWKKEHYENGDSGWVNCERCAQDHPTEVASAVPDYSRQMVLKGVGPSGQARLRASRVLVVGAGGLGVPVLTYLTGAGVGRLDVVDGDRLEPSNLHRQTLYALADVGRPKADLAAERLRALNPEVGIETHPVRLDAVNGAELIAPSELVIDCSDNFATKFLLNDLCVRLGKPVILSSVYQLEGQLQVVRADRAGACLRCIWPEATRDGLVGNCAEAGVLGPVAGVFGSLQALEALKILLDLPGQLGDELLVMDLTSHALSRVRAQRAGACRRAGRCVRLDASPILQPEAAAAELVFGDLAEALRQDFNIIDVREPREVIETPAPAERVRHIPLHALLELTLREPSVERALDRSAKYLLVCASGKRSLAATQELRARGFQSVYSLRGGITGITISPARSHERRTCSS